MFVELSSMFLFGESVRIFLRYGLTRLNHTLECSSLVNSNVYDSGYCLLTCVSFSWC